jgi:hypothetical protein
VDCAVYITPLESKSPSKSAENADNPAKLDASAFYNALQSATDDAANVVHLLDLALSTLVEMTIPASELRANDRLSSLLIVSRNLVEKISVHTWPAQPLKN